MDKFFFVSVIWFIDQFFQELYEERKDVEVY